MDEWNVKQNKKINCQSSKIIKTNKQTNIEIKSLLLLMLQYC